jgi:hypothetical protein
MGRICSWFAPWRLEGGGAGSGYIVEEDFSISGLISIPAIKIIMF